MKSEILKELQAHLILQVPLDITSIISGYLTEMEFFELVCQVFPGNMSYLELLIDEWINHPSRVDDKTIEGRWDTPQARSSINLFGLLQVAIADPEVTDKFLEIFVVIKEVKRLVPSTQLKILLKEVISAQRSELFGHLINQGFPSDASLVVRLRELGPEQSDYTEPLVHPEYIITGSVPKIHRDVLQGICKFCERSHIGPCDKGIRNRVKGKRSKGTHKHP